MGGELELTFDDYNDETNGEPEEIASEAAGMPQDICLYIILFVEKLHLPS